MTEESLEFIDNGRTFLIDREFRLINARKIALEAMKTSNKNATQTSPAAGSSQLQSYDPFKRSDVKRRSAGSSIMNIFRRSAAPSAASNNEGKLQTFFLGSRGNATFHNETLIE